MRLSGSARSSAAPEPVPLLGLDHAAIGVRDLHTSLAWYGAVLGMGHVLDDDPAFNGDIAMAGVAGVPMLALLKLPEDARPALTMEEVEKHTTKEDGWIVLFGEVINVTRYLPLHPGGEDILVDYLGKDATSDWEQIHDFSVLEKHSAYLDKLGKMRVEWGLLSRIWAKIRAPRDAPQAVGISATQPDRITQEEEAEEEEEQRQKGMQWGVEHECDLPPGGVFDLAELSRWDGVNMPMCIGVCGIVLDVSSSDNFVPNFGYGKLWAGKDTTWAMATVSLKGHDANRFDFKPEDLSPDQHKALAGWYKHFSSKYRQVGTLQELREWDFSAVLETANELPVSKLTEKS